MCSLLSTLINNKQRYCDTLATYCTDFTTFLIIHFIKLISCCDALGPMSHCSTYPFYQNEPTGTTKQIDLIPCISTLGMLITIFCVFDHSRVSHVLAVFPLSILLLSDLYLSTQSLQAAWCSKRWMSNGRAVWLVGSMSDMHVARSYTDCHGYLPECVCLEWPSMYERYSTCMILS